MLSWAEFLENDFQRTDEALICLELHTELLK